MIIMKDKILLIALGSLAAVVVVAVAIYGLFFNDKCSAGNCQNQPQAQTQPVEDKKPEEKQSVVLYDVRTPAEFKTEHLEGAINLPIEDVMRGTMPEVSKDTPIELYCRTGNRATTAKVILERNGYKDVKNLGSLEILKSDGKKTTK